MRPLQFGSNFVDPEAGIWTQKNVELRNEVRGYETGKKNSGRVATKKVVGNTLCRLDKLARFA